MVLKFYGNPLTDGGVKKHGSTHLTQKENQFYTNSSNPCSILVRVIPVGSRYVQKYGKLQYVLNRNSKLILIITNVTVINKYSFI